ncbi:MAG: TonB-dependent receptor [Bacteroidia bacterium]|nr:TonB-dependent receptor [Bacteroidia bacterium]
MKPISKSCSANFVRMKQFVGWFVGLGIVTSAWGQSDPLKGKDSLILENERIEGLPHSTKPAVVIPAPDLKSQQKLQTYSPLPLKFQPEVQITPVVVQPIGKPKWNRPENHFIKLGFGRFLAPLAQIRLNSGLIPNYSWGIAYEHESALQGYVKYATFTEHKLLLNGTLLQPNQKISASVMLHRLGYYQFGDSLALTREVSKDSLKRNFFRAELLTSIGSLPRDTSVWNYQVGLRFRHCSDQFSNQELQLALLPELFYKITPEWTVGGKVEFAWMSLQQKWNFLSDSVLSYSTKPTRLQLDFLPTLRYQQKQISATVGVRLAHFSYLDTSITTVSPFVNASYQIIPSRLQAFANWNGGITPTTLFQQLPENRFLNVQQSVFRPAQIRFDLEGGFRGNFASTVSWGLAFRHLTANQMPIWYSTEPGNIQLAYENRFQMTGGTLHLAYEQQQGFRAGFQFSYHSFLLKDLEHNFSVPPMKTDLLVGYNWNDKLIVQTGLFIYGKTPLKKQTSGEIVYQDVMIDWNFEANYRINKRFSIFAEANNLLNRKYYRWYGFQERPLDFRAGGVFHF